MEEAFFSYLIWHESSHATQRKQVIDRGFGLARGLIQIESGTLHDLIKHYVILPTTDVAQDLADSAGVSKTVMLASLKTFRDDIDAAANKWPRSTAAAAAKVEKWVTAIDSFAIVVMRLQFLRYKDKHMPLLADTGVKPDKDPEADAYKDPQHAECWANQWKRKFDDKADRKRKKALFVENAKALDIAARG